MAIIEVNAALEVPEVVSKSAISFAKSISGDHLFELGVNSIPHITVFSAYIEEMELDNLLSELENIISTDTSYRLDAYTQFIHQQGYVCIDHRTTPELLNLRRQVIDLLSVFQEKESLENYITRSKKQYRPHLTITRLANFVGSNLPITDLSDYSFDTNHITLFRSSNHGTAIERLT